MRPIQFNYRDVLLSFLNQQKKVDAVSWLKGVGAFESGLAEPLTRGPEKFTFLISAKYRDFRTEIDFSGGQAPRYQCECRSYLGCCHHVMASLFYLERFSREVTEPSEGQPFTREEMIGRVLEERAERAEKEGFRLISGDNIYGPHHVINQRQREYEVTIRDFEQGHGYCSCPDFQLNKLGTCKHLMFARQRLTKNYRNASSQQKQQYPGVEIYCDPLHDYRITWYQKGMDDIAPEIGQLFGGERFLPEDRFRSFIPQLYQLQQRREFVVRPEVLETIGRYCEQETLARLAESHQPDFSLLRGSLYEYQKQGILFSLFKKGALIADDMGLGKTVQAIGAAVLKKQLFGFTRTLVICPASLKSQWQREVERFSGEKAVIVRGPREARIKTYESRDEYFQIMNYEMVLRDVTLLASRPPDLIILDEAQKIKNYETKTSDAVKSIPKRHAIVITGTPLENKLIDLYSIMNFIDPRLLSPLWEFSMNHCIFDRTKKNRVTGYYNLLRLKERLQPVVIRREKREVLQQLPAIQEMNVPVELSAEQAEMHAGFARGVMVIMQKKYMTAMDLQRLQQLLQLMRMSCDSTYLIDKETNISPKLNELEDILINKLDLPNNQRKVLIFSEWRDMLRLIGHRLSSSGLGHVTLSGEVAVDKRGALIAEFEQNPECRVFLSTESGGAGLNLQVADTVINFDLPWNPAKKNQRIGRIDRLGQQSPHLLVVNLIAANAIESRIADGILLKQDLFDAVLKESSQTDLVDFARKGKSTFFTQLKDLLTGLDQPSAGSGEEEPPAPAAAAEPDPGVSGLEPAEGGTSPGESVLTLAGEDEESLDRPETSGLAPDPSCRLRETDKSAVREAGAPPPAREGLETGRLPEPPRGGPPAAAESRPPVDAAELEQTLNQGLAFLGGLMRMATGQGLAMEGKSVTVDRATGEVVMKFKLPGF